MNLPIRAEESSRTAPRRALTLDADLFGTYAARLVRRWIASQFVGEGHDVLREEDRLLEQSRGALRTHLEGASLASGMSWRLMKMAVAQHVRKLVAKRLRLHDVDPSTANQVLESSREADFDGIFPASWADA